MSANALSQPELANVLEIDWFDGTDEIGVTPRNQIRFTIQKDRAIEALRIARDSERFTWQFDLLLTTLGKWAKAHSGDVQSAIVTLQDNSLMFVVMQSKVSYDEMLQDDLSELDFSVAHDTDLDLIKLRTILLPPVDNETLGSFWTHAWFFAINMASEQDHIRLANSNQGLIDHLIDVNSFPDWLVTVAFYKAVHVVEAMFANHMGRHSCSHADREDRLKRNPQFKAIFANYAHLLTESRIARYLLAPAHHLTMETVKSQLIYKRLYGVEQNSLQFLSASAKTDLLKIEPPGTPGALAAGPTVAP